MQGGFEYSADLKAQVNSPRDGKLDNFFDEAVQEGLSLTSTLKIAGPESTIERNEHFWQEAGNSRYDTVPTCLKSIECQRIVSYEDRESFGLPCLRKSNQILPLTAAIFDANYVLLFAK